MLPIDTTILLLSKTKVVIWFKRTKQHSLQNDIHFYMAKWFLRKFRRFRKTYCFYFEAEVLSAAMGTHTYIIRSVIYCLLKDSVSSFLFLSATSFYLTVLGVEGYCCFSSNTMTHTHTRTCGRTPLEE
jgi:hypothetical protein